jgi:hypothetical protein
MRKYDQLAQAQANYKTLFQEFGTFLKIQTLPTGAPISPGTATTLSQLKTRFCKDWKGDYGRF